ncbi:hypothetical protein SKAU_G00162350 [Synaphobranchus kaupii]|uniref:Uncharacterized protein n=1 Tax=Synaphobranchus kaupii TaxID=118154 RepID=A0A9Q1FIS1_SYNKA|nr:hypothetical protein SKAU_G00162350 [Synaphobranchus kaupii]
MRSGVEYGSEPVFDVLFKALSHCRRRHPDEFGQGSLRGPGSDLSGFGPADCCRPLWVNPCGNDGSSRPDPLAGCHCTRLPHNRARPQVWADTVTLTETPAGQGLTFPFAPLETFRDGARDQMGSICDAPFPPPKLVSSSFHAVGEHSLQSQRGTMSRIERYLDPEAESGSEPPQPHNPRLGKLLLSLIFASDYG